MKTGIVFAFLIFMEMSAFATTNVNVLRCIYTKSSEGWNLYANKYWRNTGDSYDLPDGQLLFLGPEWTTFVPPQPNLKNYGYCSTMTGTAQSDTAIVTAHTYIGNGSNISHDCSVAGAGVTEVDNSSSTITRGGFSEMKADPNGTGNATMIYFEYFAVESIDRMDVSQWEDLCNVKFGDLVK